MAFGKTKVDTAGFERLKLSLKQGTLGGAFFFYGEEDYLQERYLDMVKEKVLEPGMESFNFHELMGKEVVPALLEQTVDCFPMMAQRTLVLVKDWDVMKLSEDHRASLLDILADIPPYCTLIFYFQSVELKMLASKYLTALKERGTFVQFARQNQSALMGWVQRHFSDLGKEIPPPVVTELIFYCGDSMTVLAGEIQKIGAYAQGKVITKEDIWTVATPHIDAMAYTMTDSMGMGDFDSALKVLYELHQMKEPALKIVSAISRMLRQLYGVKLALLQGKNQAFVSDMFGLRPYPAKKLIESAHRFSLEWCRVAVVESSKTDLKLKSSGKSGDTDQLMIITELLLTLAGEKQ